MHERDPSFVAILAVTWVWLLAPLVPIRMAWAGVSRGTTTTRGQARTQQALLVLVTLSQLLLVGGLLRAEVIGTDYTDRRFLTIWVNLIAMAGSAIVAAFTRGGERLALLTAAALLASAWYYVLAMSSAI